MEFKLNHIHIDVMDKLHEETKEEKVHYSKEISPSEHYAKDNEEFNNNYFENQESYKVNFKRKFITIDAIKSTKEIVVNVEKDAIMNDENSIGRTIDTKE